MRGWGEVVGCVGRGEGGDADRASSSEDPSSPSSRCGAGTLIRGEEEGEDVSEQAGRLVPRDDAGVRCEAFKSAMAARRRWWSLDAHLRRDSAAAMASRRASARAMRARALARVGSSWGSARSMPMLYRVGRGLRGVEV